ncbi:hypothetical protein [Kineococcus sp. SYSU DK006]|uniref:hypothetical protein n=1 Tax=Kineococcus sp. SYSU DK006 TaxID=3383127 RepID=UPI003D7C6EBA
MDLSAAQPPTPAAREAAAVREWWWAAPAALRAQLSRSGPQAPLSRTVSSQLSRLGVTCSLVLVAEHDRLVRRALPPAALRQLMAEHTAEHTPEHTPAPAERTGAPTGQGRAEG